MEGRHDLPEVGFVKVPCDDRGSVRVFVDVAAELLVEFGQSQARVCLWWNVMNRLLTANRQDYFKLELN